LQPTVPISKNVVFGTRTQDPGIVHIHIGKSIPHRRKVKNKLKKNTFGNQ